MDAACSPNPLHGYYKWHARIYDATRWSFLFGRNRLLRLASDALGPRRFTPLSIVEVGCGTGRNLARLARAFPAASLAGIDLCRPMIIRAARAVAGDGPRCRLLCDAYRPDSLPAASADLVVFSYSLSMFNPGFEEALDAARLHLAPGGLVAVAVADFRRTAQPWFARWMGVNHVRMDDHLLPALGRRFESVREETLAAYGGWWEYFVYLGR